MCLQLTLVENGLRRMKDIWIILSHPHLRIGTTASLHIMQPIWLTSTGRLSGTANRLWVSFMPSLLLPPFSPPWTELLQSAFCLLRALPPHITPSFCGPCKWNRKCGACWDSQRVPHFLIFLKGQHKEGAMWSNRELDCHLTQFWWVHSGNWWRWHWWEWSTGWQITLSCLWLEQLFIHSPCGSIISTSLESVLHKLPRWFHGGYLILSQLGHIWKWEGGPHSPNRHSKHIAR